MKTSEKIKPIAKKFGTPFYLFDKSTIVDSFFKVKKAFSSCGYGATVSYAVKANSLPAIVKIFKNLDGWYDVISTGESELLDSLGADPRKITYTSVSETGSEFRHAITKGVRLFVLGSYSGLEELKKAADGANTKVNVLIRVNPLADVKAAIGASGKFSKFGVPFDGNRDSVDALLTGVREEPTMIFKGFHFHLGTQVKSPSYYAQACDAIFDFADKKKVDFEIMDVGGGFPITYLKQAPPIEKFAKAICSRCRRHAKKRGKLQLIVEPGRALVAESGSLVTKVMNVKKIFNSNVTIVDAGYNLLHDVLLGQRYPIKVVSRSKKKMITRIAGNLCDGLDWLEKKRISIPCVRKGDLILFEKVGAYSTDFNMKFCNMPLPPVLLYNKDGRVTCVRRKNEWQ